MRSKKNHLCTRTTVLTRNGNAIKHLNDVLKYFFLLTLKNGSVINHTNTRIFGFNND